MAGVSGGLLAAEVSSAGALGFIAAGHFDDVNKLEEEIALFESIMKSATSSSATSESNEGLLDDSNLCIGFIGHSSLSSPEGWAKYDRLLQTHKPKAVQFFAPSIIKRQSNSSFSNVELAHQHGVKFIAQVGSVLEAKEAIHHNVDAIFCQGSEAGGHGLRRELGNSTITLASQVSKLTDIPVLAAGGVATGRHLASALCVCDGAVLGTRFWASKESLGNMKLQQELIRDNSCDDVVRTEVFDQIENELKEHNKWPHPYDSVGALRNETTVKWEGRPRNEVKNAMLNTDLIKEYKQSTEESDATVVAVLAGEGVGEIDSIDCACDIVLKIEQEAVDTIRRLNTLQH